MRIVFLLALLLAPTARAVTLETFGERIVSPSFGCPTGSLDCAASADALLLSGGELDGHLILDELAGTATVSLRITFGANFAFDGAPSLGFYGWSYSGTVPITAVPGGFVQAGASDANVRYVDAPPIADLLTPMSGLACDLFGGGAVARGASCSVTFGPEGFTYYGRDWQHTVAFSAVPEPGAALLVLVGLALAARRYSM